jgi:hypothetical protein
VRQGLAGRPRGHACFARDASVSGRARYVLARDDLEQSEALIGTLVLSLARAKVSARGLALLELVRAGVSVREWRRACAPV